MSRKKILKDLWIVRADAKVGDVLSIQELIKRAKQLPGRELLVKHLEAYPGIARLPNGVLSWGMPADLRWSLINDEGVQSCSVSLLQHLSDRPWEILSVIGEQKDAFSMINAYIQHGNESPIYGVQLRGIRDLKCVVRFIDYLKLFEPDSVVLDIQSGCIHDSISLSKSQA